MPQFAVSTARSTVDIDLKVNLHPSHITAHGLRGTIDCELDEQGRPRLDAPYAADLSVPVEIIKSGHNLQDREMRRRFDVRKYPEITVKVIHGEQTGSDGAYRATAQITMHGVSRQIEGDVRIAVDGSTMTVEGEHIINVKDFGIDPPRLIILKVEPEVTVHAKIVATTT
jgi:polyisoprenoid-binding protein YceI